MRYKIIDDKRLNVYLTQKDLEKENVKIEDIVDSSPESIRKIKKIFFSISDIAGFDIKDRGLNIVLMPIVDGDLIISACVSNIAILTQEETEIFVYNDFENVICACLAVMDMCNVKSSLYLLSKEYYLCVKTQKCLKESYLNFISVLSEYGSKTDFTDLYIKEHAKALINDIAIEKISMHFCRKV